MKDDPFCRNNLGKCDNRAVCGKKFGDATGRRGCGNGATTDGADIWCHGGDTADNKNVPFSVCFIWRCTSLESVTCMEISSNLKEIQCEKNLINF